MSHAFICWQPTFTRNRKNNRLALTNSTEVKRTLNVDVLIAETRL